MAVLEMLRKLRADGDVDFLREGVRVLAAALMEAEVTELICVPKGEGAPEPRLTNRNGYRKRSRVLAHPAMQVFSGRSHLDRTGVRAQ
jgi:transposase-like protein